MFRVVFCALYCALTLGHGYAALTCEELLAAKLAGNRAIEQAVLDTFSVEQLADGPIGFLGSGVYQLALKSGETVVLRLAGNKSDAGFEDFVSRIYAAAPHLGTPAVRKLSPEVVRPVVSAISKKAISDDLSRAALAQQWAATVAVFHPMEPGRRYLDQRFGVLMRDELVNYEEPGPTGRNAPGGGNAVARQARRRMLRQSWSSATAAARTSILEDVKFLLPEIRFATAETFIDVFVESRRDLAQWRLTALNSVVWKKISPAMRAQIANAWALSKVLGIPDFHWNNWLTDGAVVLPIDLAYRSANFNKGSVELLDRADQSPITGGAVSESELRLLLREITPDTIGFLQALSPKALERWAAESGFPLTSTQSHGALARRTALLSAREEL